MTCNVICGRTIHPKATDNEHYHMIALADDMLKKKKKNIKMMGNIFIRMFRKTDTHKNLTIVTSEKRV